MAEPTTEAAAIAKLAEQGTRPIALDEAYYLPATGELVSLEPFEDEPRAKRGTVQAHDAASLIAYTKRHADVDETVVYVDRRAGTIVAVLDDHRRYDADDGIEIAGWADHVARWTAKPTPEWTRWLTASGNLLGQEQFAELIEDGAAEITRPPAADMLELAQTFHASKSVTFQSSRRLASGESQFVYVEELEARAGQTQTLTVPQTFELAVIPFDGAARYKLVARLRYRLDGGRLRIGYVLDRPDDVWLAAIDDVTQAVREGVDPLPVLNGIPDLTHRGPRR